MLNISNAYINLVLKCQRPLQRPLLWMRIMVTHFGRMKITKGVKNLRAAFKILAEGGKPPPVYEKTRCHMIFDFKMENFRRKSRLVAGGHVTEPPDTIRYTSVVSRETVRVVITVEDLNNLHVRTADIHNAFIQAPVSEDIWIVLGPEFGPYAVKSVVVGRALYGLKNSRDSFWNHLADFMKHMEYMSCPEDPDLWMKPMVRPSDGVEYYVYILL